MSHDNMHPSREDQVTSNLQRRPWYIQHFTKLLIGFGLAGGTIALILPWALWLLCGMTPDNSDLLRLHLLYVTGGIIAVLTLLQTNWKNQGDRLKIDDDIKKNEQDAEKNERDHIRQVHAERRSRYTKAVEQLANENAAVRLGGVYTLVGLVDEWLADESISDRHQEGQVIINNLCSYIRSPFPLAEKIDEYKAHKKFEELKEKESENLLSDLEPFELKALSKRFTNSQDYKEPEDITADYAAFHEEQDVRRTIFVEMGKRSSLISNKEESDVTVTPGAWSDFDFDFSRAPIFYPLNGLTIEKGNFSDAKFYADTTFFKVTFNSDANFGKATFNSDANFGKATFNSNVYFGEATFNSIAYFGEATFNSIAYFGEATFNSIAYFDKATFNSIAYFDKATFNSDAYFSEATFNSDTDFREATFNNCADFNSYADFSKATFNSKTYFNEATFNSKTYFNEATFNSDADFTGVTFISNAYFRGAIFTESEPIFAIAETDSEEEWKARFSATANPQDYDFSVSSEGKPINCGTVSLLGKSFTIPFGTVLFDPTSWDEQKEIYTRVSTPAE